MISSFDLSCVDGLYDIFIWLSACIHASVLLCNVQVSPYTVMQFFWALSYSYHEFTRSRWFFFTPVNCCCVSLHEIFSFVHLISFYIMFLETSYDWKDCIDFVADHAHAVLCEWRNTAFNWLLEPLSQTGSPYSSALHLVQYCLTRELKPWTRDLQNQAKQFIFALCTLKHLSLWVKSCHENFISEGQTG